jgi:hypothetical protein
MNLFMNKFMSSSYFPWHQLNLWYNTNAMASKQYLAKSFEEDFILKTLNGKKKEHSQTIQNILDTRTIQPNTHSFGQEKRLACTFLHDNYLKTYRAQGLIFQTQQKPDFIYPFDIVLLSEAEKIVVQYYRIQHQLHLHYNHELIPGFERFIFDDIPALLKKYPTQETLMDDINRFRTEHGHGIVPKQKRKLIEYNEVIFHDPVEITPVAIFGYRSAARNIAREYGLPHFTSAKKFYESLKE